MPRQTSEEQPNHRHLDQCFTRLHFSLVILTHFHKEMPFPPFDVLVGIVATDPDDSSTVFTRMANLCWLHLGEDAFLVVRVQPDATPATKASRSHTRRKRRKW